MTVEAGGAAAPADTSVSSAPIEHEAAPPAPLSETPPAGEAAKPEPPKPVPSTRDALRAAAAKVEQGETAKAAEGKDPKDTAKGADLVRDDKTGKFAPKAGEAKADPAKPADIAAAKAAVDAKAGDVKDPKAAAADPAAAKGDKGGDFAAPKHTAPERFSPDAKAVWETAPEPVKAEVSRMHRELTAGIEKHRAGAERDASLNEFHEMAGKSGKQLPDVVREYVNMETLLRQNPMKGLETICERIGVSLRQVSEIVLGQAPDQARNQSEATIRDLNQKIARLEQQVGGVTQHFQQQGQSQLESHISKWADSRPHFEVYAPHIAAELKAGAADLDEAEARVFEKYPALAALAKQDAKPAPAADPDPKASSANDPDLEAQTLKGQKSIKGAPSSGSEPAAQPRSSSIKEALRRAAARAG